MIITLSLCLTHVPVELQVSKWTSVAFRSIHHIQQPLLLVVLPLLLSSSSTSSTSSPSSLSPYTGNLSKFDLQVYTEKFVNFAVSMHIFVTKHRLPHDKDNTDNCIPVELLSSSGKVYIPIIRTVQ